MHVRGGIRVWLLQMTRVIDEAIHKATAERTARRSAKDRVHGIITSGLEEVLARSKRSSSTASSAALSSPSGQP